MTNQVLPTVPDREALRALYDEAIGQINPSRPAIDLTTGFYAETGNAVFDAGYLALSDYCKGSAGPRRLHVVSAPAGGGKGDPRSEENTNDDFGSCRFLKALRSSPADHGVPRLILRTCNVAILKST